MEPQRNKIIKQYVVFRLKLIEVLHLMMLSAHLSSTGSCPENVLSHDADRFKETLLTTTVSMFMSVCDNPKRSTNARQIWKKLYPAHSTAIDRIWDQRISAGEQVMKNFRDQAGAHGDRLDKYLDGKLGLFREKREVVSALLAFMGLATCLLRREAKEIPDLPSEIEAVLLDAELAFPERQGFNRRWLREMHVIESGRFTKTYR